MGNLKCYFSAKYLVVAGLLMLMSCTVKRPAATTTILHLDQHPQEFKLKPEHFQEEFKKILKNRAHTLPYPELIDVYYLKKNYQLSLTPRFLPKGQFQTLLDYLNNVNHHGLDSKAFAAETLKKRLAAVAERKVTDAIYIHRGLAELELSALNSLIRYSMALQFGVIDPVQIYKQYTTPTLKPDSSAVLAVLEVGDLKKYLDSIQPVSKAYLSLKKALMAKNIEENSDSARTLIVNLERLRWKNKPQEPMFVQVNIPDFSLDVIDKGKSILYMKVCVGEPGEWETPQLGSMIDVVQVNPVWNIPLSIASNEISKQAAGDKYYLANSGIHVYHKGKRIINTESIDWLSADINEYTFQQQPGTENALGRIKFLFKNEHSVYLHDTPAKSAFKKPMRAVSHGCVRIEKPLQLAYALFGKGDKYQQIKSAIQKGYPPAKFIGLPKKIPIRLTYDTASVDPNGNIKYIDDVYALDDTLYAAIQKFNQGK